MPNQPPDYITETLYRQLGPIETDHEERRIDELAQAVWDALLAKSRVWWMDSKDQSDVMRELYSLTDPFTDHRVLVIPLGDEHA